jgi:polysaccharide pyruvyl transferase WcaK-like protein/glycosyltransferase involved in cell wall biosynthesis
VKVLFVTQANPDAKGSGWQRRAAQHLRALQRCGEVTVLLPRIDPEQPDPGAVERLRAMGVKQVIVRVEESIAEHTATRQKNARGKMSHAVASLAKRPWLDARVQRGDRAKYRSVLLAGFDVVFAFRIESAVWVDSVLRPAEFPAVSILDFDDIESRKLAPVIAMPGHSAFWRAKLTRQLDWLRNIERRFLNDWTATCLCSELDVRRMAEAYGRKPWVVPNAYTFADPLPEPDTRVAELLFVGSFSYAPNVAAVGWFVERVWPLVRAQLGNGVRATIVGFFPTPDIEALRDVQGLSVVANAPEIEPFYARANIVIAPILSGSGTRTKLIEAAARGRAMVTTLIGSEGLDFEDGVHAEIADTPEEFAARIVKLAGDRALRARLSNAARSHAAEWFDTDRVEAELVQQVRASLRTAETSQRHSTPRRRATLKKFVTAGQRNIYRLRRPAARNSALIIPPAEPGSLGDAAMIEVVVSRMRRLGTGMVEIASRGEWSITERYDVQSDLENVVNWGGLRARMGLIPKLASYRRVGLLGADNLDGGHGAGHFWQLAVIREASYFADSVTVFGASFNANPSAEAVAALRGLPDNVTICARDPVSHARMEEALNRPVRAVADLAFLLEADFDAAASRVCEAWIAEVRSTSNRVVGLNANCIHHEKSPRYLAGLAIVLDRLLEEECVVVLVPHDIRGPQNDVILLESLRSALPPEQQERVHMMPVTTPGAAKAVIAQLDFVVTSRMHAAIFAAGSGIPSVSIAYQGKFEGLYQLLGLENEGLLIDSEHFQHDPAGVVQTVLAKIDDAQRLGDIVRNNLPMIRALAEANFDGF